MLLGCGGSPRTATPDRTVESLPALGDYLPPLDNARVEVAPPAGWHVPSRDSRFVVRFTPSPEASYPSILLTAEDHQGIAEVTGENVDAFVREVDAAMNKDGLRRRNRPPGPRRWFPAKFVGAMYQKRAKVKADMATRMVDRLILETVAAGRKYRLELRTEQGTVDRYRGDLLAVAEGIRFLERESQQVARASGDPSAATKPTEAAPKTRRARTEPEPKRRPSKSPRRSRIASPSGSRCSTRSRKSNLGWESPMEFKEGQTVGIDLGTTYLDDRATRRDRQSGRRCPTRTTSRKRRASCC